MQLLFVPKNKNNLIDLHFDFIPIAHVQKSCKKRQNLPQL